MQASETTASQYQPPPTALQRMFHRRRMQFVLVVMLAGNLFAWWNPVWLAPPRLRTTLPVYVFIIPLVWIPVLIVSRPDVRRMGTRTLLIFMGLGLAIWIMTLAILGASSISGLGGTTTCDVPQRIDDEIIYVCQSDEYDFGDYSTTIYRLRRLNDLPFVVVLEADEQPFGDIAF